MEHCISCGCESGTHIVCTQCRLLKTSAQRSKWDRVFQERICRDAVWQCSYCGGDFNYEEGKKLVCADHIKTKGAYPELRYDLLNARCTCCAGGNNCHNKRGAGHLSPYQFTAKPLEYDLEFNQEFPLDIECNNM